MKRGFTLAEVLITLGIIGVVAAITMPPLITNVTEKVNSERQTNIAQKLTQAMEQMRANGSLNTKYASTEAFVDELQKYIKIAKRCDSDHISECWPTDKVTDGNGNEFEVSKAKTGKNLSLETTTNNVGLVLADGATLILNYDPTARTWDVGDRIKTTKYTSEVTGAIDFVMDVNGGKGPNKEGSRYDIRPFKIARFTKGCAGIEIDGIGCVFQILSNEPETDPSKSYFLANGREWETEDYWEGAKNACRTIGMELPDINTLSSIYSSHASGLPTEGEFFWSSTEHEENFPYAWGVFFDDGYVTTEYKGETYGILCVGN